ncbi:MAG: hypothetical protein V4649_06440 [Bacteroidota bacterium]
MKKQSSGPDNNKGTGKKKKGGSALAAASVGRSATAQAHRHSDPGGLGRTGTNVIYEGATAPGAGSSVGTGYASGRPSTGSRITTNSDYEQNRGGSPSKVKEADNAKTSRTAREEGFDGEF